MLRHAGVRELTYDLLMGIEPGGAPRGRADRLVRLLATIVLSVEVVIGFAALVVGFVAMAWPQLLYQAAPPPGDQVTGGLDPVHAAAELLALAIVVAVGIAGLRSLRRRTHRASVAVFVGLVFAAAGVAYYATGLSSPAPFIGAQMAAVFSRRVATVRAGTPIWLILLLSCVLIALLGGLAALTLERSSGPTGSRQRAWLATLVMVPAAALGSAANFVVHRDATTATEAPLILADPPTRFAEAAAWLGGTYAAGTDWLAQGARVPVLGQSLRPNTPHDLSCPAARTCVTIVSSAMMADADLDRVSATGSIAASTVRPSGRSDSGLFGQIACMSAQHCLAEDELSEVGGYLYSTSDGGARWTRIPLPPHVENANFIGPPETTITCGAPAWCDVLAVAYRPGQLHAPSRGTALVLRTSDGGQHWQSSVIGPHGTSATSITCPTPNDCLVSGRLRNRPALWFTHDGGHSWHVATPGSSPASFDGVSCATPNECLAVGTSNGVTPCECITAAAPGRAIVEQTTDGGRTWTTETVARDVEVTGVSCAQSGRCLVIGARDPIENRWAGYLLGLPWMMERGSFHSAWSSVRSPPALYVPTSASCFDSGCMVVGAFYADASAYGFPSVAFLPVTWDGTSAQLKLAPAFGSR
jgi:hypothetical protein